MIISLGYRRQVGKDLFYSLTKQYITGRNVHRVAFADALKDEVYERILKPDGLSRDLLDQVGKKEIFRPMLQWYATSYKRNAEVGGYSNYWIDRGIEKVLSLQEQDPSAIIIVSDVRFYNEILALKNLGAIAVKINRKVEETESSQHISETSLDDFTYMFDIIIDNNGTIEEYKDKIIDLINGVDANQAALMNFNDQTKVLNNSFQ